MSEASKAGVIRSISVEDLDRIGIDADNNLYWDGKRVETRQRLALNWWQSAGALVVTVGAFLGGLGAAVTGVKDGAELLCQHDYHVACPRDRSGKRHEAAPETKPASESPATQAAPPDPSGSGRR